MTFEQAVAELRNRHPKAELSLAAKHGEEARRAAGLRFKRDRGGVYAGRDADGTEVLVYFNDTANLIACTAIEADPDPDDE